jgi:hypothetical protein
VSSSVSLTSALANPAVGHIVLFPGTYYLSAELNITRSVVLEAAVPGSVVLNAQASSSSQRRVLNINPGPSGVVQLIGLNITGGYIQSYLGGGGVLVDSGTVSIMSSQIYGNTNGAGDGGGVFVNYEATVSITNCQVFSNQAGLQDGQGSQLGGGICVSGGTLTISSSSVYGNAARYFGGGVAVNSGSVSIISSQIHNNSVSYMYGSGGGVFFSWRRVSTTSSWWRYLCQWRHRLNHQLPSVLKPS